MTISYNNPESREEVEKTFQFIEDQLDLSKDHPRNLEYYLKVYKTHPSLLMVAKEEDRVIGCSFGSKNQFNPQATDEIVIGEMCVHPNYQGKKIGSSLLMHVEKNGKNIGFKKIILGAVKGVEPFYFRNNYLANLHIQMGFFRQNLSQK